MKTWEVLLVTFLIVQAIEAGRKQSGKDCCPKEVSCGGERCKNDDNCPVGQLCCKAECRGKRCSCPKGKGLVFCFVEPCSVTFCPTIPKAECRNDYCGGCFARFFLGDKEVTKKCEIKPGPPPPPVPANCPTPSETGICAVTCQPGSCFGREICCPTACGGTSCVCPVDVPVAACSELPCDSAVCMNFQSADCRNTFCGGCGAIFVNNNNDGQTVEVTDQCSNVPPNCPIPTGLGICAFMCQPGSCFGRELCCPTACGGTSCVCPIDVPVATCSELPCDSAVCPKIPSAVCRNTFCGGCGAIFVNVNDDGQTVEVTDQCSNGKCPTPGNEDCTNNCLTDRDCDPGLTCCDSLCPSKQCSCPPDTPQVNCVQDPCNVVTCPAVPRARCFGNICGECRARFFRRRREVTDQCNP